MEKTAHLAVGRAGEDEAAKLLRGLGWKILARNWRPAASAGGGAAPRSTRDKLLELDIIAKDKDFLVFVEVKTRSLPRDASGSEAQGGIPAYAAFTAKKQALLVKSASLYCTASGAWEQPLRFDLICAYRAADGLFSLEHYRNVIEFGQTVGGGDTAWQPW